SDGASESFDPAQWARVVADRFLAAREADKQWLAGACRAYGAMHDREAMSWSRQAAYDRGSYTTLLGVALNPSGRRATVTAVAVLRELKSKVAFKGLVDRERAARRMRRDDTTLLVLGMPSA